MRTLAGILIIIAAAGTLVASAGLAQEAPPSLPQIAQMMRPFLVESIPPVLYERSRDWGRTSMTPNALVWHGLRPEIRKAPKNDGHWQKIRLSPRQLGHSLDFRLSQPRPVDKERQIFDVFLTFMVTVDHERQLWESGVRLYSGSTRARARVMLWMDIENTIRLDAKKSSLVPDLVVRLKATKAKLECNDIVVEHTAGVGGTAARWIGEAVEGLVREAQPNLERQLLDRAGAAIVRAADTREIRIGLHSLLK